MPAKIKRFTVLTLSDRDKWGFDDQTLPPLIALMESAAPDYLHFVFSGVTGYFITSAHSQVRVEKAIRDAEKLRDADALFSRLGIGLAEGDLLGQFNWRGGLKKSAMHPLGPAVNEAVRCAQNPGLYEQKLKAFGSSHPNHGL